MFSTLIQPHHIVSSNLKEIEFEEGIARGYFARKDKNKYWITEDTFDLLPIRIKDTQELKYKEDIVLNPHGSIITFRIKPEQTMKVRDMVDGFCPFTHTHPDQLMLLKFIAISSYIGKTFICVASEPNFLKSSIFKVIHSITDKCPVFKPRSIPGVLNKISGTGNMVFDEAHECKKDIRDIMEEFALDIGGGSTVYINGAMKSANTKNKYDCALQSITFLYNNLDCYREPDKKYFEVIFSNNKAMDDRFLKLKLKGKLTQKFTRNFDIAKTADDNRQFYIDWHKELEFLKEYKGTAKAQRKWVTKSVLDLKGRRRVVYDEITWLIDVYSQTQDEYDKYVKLLDEAVIGYKEMVAPLLGIMQEEEKIEVEDVE